MKLAAYLASTGASATDLADKIGVSVSTITRAAKGQVVPSPALMEKIAAFTGGQVMPNDFFDLPGGHDALLSAEDRSGSATESAGNIRSETPDARGAQRSPFANATGSASPSVIAEQEVA